MFADFKASYATPALLVNVSVSLVHVLILWWQGFCLRGERQKHAGAQVPRVPM